MSPRFRAGERAYLSRSTEPRNGDDVMVNFRDGTQYFAQLISRARGIITCIRYNRPGAAVFREEDVISIDRPLCAAIPSDRLPTLGLHGRTHTERLKPNRQALFADSIS